LLTIRALRPLQLHWFRFNLARIKLHEAMIDCLRAITPEDATMSQDDIKAKVTRNVEFVRTGITDFLGGVAFALGDIDEQGAFCYSTTSTPGEVDSVVNINTTGVQRLILPLYILRHSEYLTTLQSDGIEDALLRMGRELHYPWASSSRSPKN
jgi:hypothetical protein